MAWPPCWWSRSSTSSRSSTGRAPRFSCGAERPDGPERTDWGYVLETGRVTLTGPGRELADEAVKKAYLGGLPGSARRARSAGLFSISSP